MKPAAPVTRTDCIVAYLSALSPTQRQEPRAPRPVVTSQAVSNSNPKIENTTFAIVPVLIAYAGLQSCVVNFDFLCGTLLRLKLLINLGSFRQPTLNGCIISDCSRK